MIHADIIQTLGKKAYISVFYAFFTMFINIVDRKDTKNFIF